MEENELNEFLIEFYDLNQVEIKKESQKIKFKIGYGIEYEIIKNIKLTNDKNEIFKIVIFKELNFDKIYICIKKENQKSIKIKYILKKDKYTFIYDYIKGQDITYIKEKIQRENSLEIVAQAINIVDEIYNKKLFRLLQTNYKYEHFDELGKLMK